MAGFIFDFPVKVIFLVSLMKCCFGGTVEQGVTAPSLRLPLYHLHDFKPKPALLPVL